MTDEEEVPEPDDSRRRSLVGDLLAAVRGQRPDDLTAAPLDRAVLFLAVPMVLEGSLTTIFTICDTYFVGRLGSAAVASMAVGESVLLTIDAVAMGLATGIVATVARRTGEKDPDAAARVAVQVFGLGFVLALVLGGLGALYAEELLRLMGARDDLVAAGRTYTVHLFGGSGLFLLTILGGAVLRSSGNPAYALRALTLANLVNLILDPLLIFGLGPFPDLGVTGAAVATNVSRFLALLYLLRVFVRGTAGVRIERRHLKLEPEILSRLLRLSGVATLQYFLNLMSLAGVVRVLAPFSSAAVAGFIVSWRVLAFVMMPIWAAAGAAGILAGQSLGAGKPERAERAVWLTARYATYVLAAVAVFFFFAAPALVRFLAPADEIVAYGSECLRWIALGCVFMGYGVVVVRAFNSAGDTVTPTWINLGCHWGLKVFLGGLLAWPLGLGPTGIFLAIPLAEIAVAGTGVLLFRRGRWKHRRV